MVFSISSTLSSSASSDDRVFAFIQDTVGKQIVSVVAEAKKYCYKCFDGAIGTIDLDFVHDCTGV